MNLCFQVYLDVPGELPWAARRWADVETLSLCSSHNKMHKETETTLDSSDPNEVQPLTKLAQLEIITGDHLEEDNAMADILKSILKRAPNVGLLHLEAWGLEKVDRGMSMPEMSGVKHLILSTWYSLEDALCASLQNFCSLGNALHRKQYH